MQVTVTRRIMLIIVGLVLLAASLVLVAPPLQRSAHGAISCTQYTLDWGLLGWDETNVTTAEVNPYFDEVLHNENPFHGLGSSTGGTNNFLSQTFTNVRASQTDISVQYSHNMFDQTTLDTPNLYGGAGGTNPDRRATGPDTLRFNRDYSDNYAHGTLGNVRSPATVVVSFSRPVYMNELIAGSLSVIQGDSENVVIRAFDGPDATGNIVKASAFDNVSDADDDSTLVHKLGDPTGPLQTNDLSNVNLDPDNTFDASGRGTNIGLAADDGIYHAIGAVNQLSGAYGRVAVRYENTPIRSIALSTWMTDTATDFTSATYTNTSHSIIVAPLTFCPANHDYGDAPDATLDEQQGDYRTIGNSSGAVHEIDTALRIGATTDADNSKLQDVDASSDDADGIDDEDGVLDTSQLTIRAGQFSPEVDVVVLNLIELNATLYGWIDYDCNGIFDNATERTSAAVPNGTDGAVTLAFPNVPGGIDSTCSTTYMRLRLSTDSDPSSNPTGAVSNGEVEDYVMEILGAETIAVTELADTGWPVIASLAAGGVIILSSILLTKPALYRVRR